MVQVNKLEMCGVLLASLNFCSDQTPFALYHTYSSFNTLNSCAFLFIGQNPHTGEMNYLLSPQFVALEQQNAVNIADHADRSLQIYDHNPQMNTAREPWNTSRKLKFSISGSFTPSPPSFSLPHALSSYIPRMMTLLPYNQRKIIPSF